MSITNRADRVAEMIDILIEREEKYEIFLHASPFGIMVVDKTFHIVFVNKVVETLSGWKMSELLGKHMYILMPERTRVGHHVHEKQYLARPFVLERINDDENLPRPTILRKDGTEVPVELSVAPVEVQGQTLFYASVRTV